MADSSTHQAAHRAKRKAANARKLSFYLTEAENDLLLKLKAQHGTDRASVVAALRMAVEA